MIGFWQDAGSLMDKFQTYTTLDGRTLDLTELTTEQIALFEQGLALYRRGRSAKQFHQLANLVSGRTSPLLASSGGRVTQSVWDQPLYQAMRDLEDRLGIRVGELEAMPGDQLDTDPLVDEWIPAVQAAASKGVTLAALHKAVGRGDLLARPSKPGGSRLVVSLRSLGRWAPNPQRQAAAREHRSTRSGRPRLATSPTVANSGRRALAAS